MLVTKEQELEQKLDEALNRALADRLKSPPQLQEVMTGKQGLKSYLCRLRLNDTRSNPIAAEFLFEKHFLEGYIPGEYRVASWADRCIPSTIVVTAYPRGGIIGTSLGVRKFVFLPAYQKNIEEFHSDRIFKEKIGWYPLVEKLVEDAELASWFRQMPVNVETRKRKLTLEFGSPRDFFSCFGQLVPATKDQKNMTTIGFRCIPDWKVSWTGVVSGMDLSYMSNLAMIIQRISDHIQNYDFRSEIVETFPVVNRRLLGLTGEAMRMSA